MSNKIQMTEEQAVDLYERTVSDSNLHLGNFMYRCKEKGYIKKSELEIVKEEYYELTTKDGLDLDFKKCVIIDKYVIELEKEIERLKNES